MVAQIVAETLGCTLQRVKVIAADTDLTPGDIGSYSSRVTFMNGNAALGAAKEIRQKIVAAAAKKMNCSTEDVSIPDDLVSKRRSNGPRPLPAEADWEASCPGHVE